MTRLIESTERGLYCPPGDFFIDPWAPVPWAIVTHSHSDHARIGCERYLTASAGERVLREKLGEEATIDIANYGERITHRGVHISLHPAGHILGSAQVRIEHAGEVCVISGDYKTDSDPTCEAFEPLACHTFVTESTFGLPIYRWPAAADVFAEIHAWWRENQTRGRTSLLFAWSLGKAQRLLAGLEESIGPILTHGAVERFVSAYRSAGVALPTATHATDDAIRANRASALVLAPPSALHSPWARKFGEASTAIASGWMQIRGARRRRAVDRGFVLSDHADWNGLLDAIAATGAKEILVTHGYTNVLTRWLAEHGKRARAIVTRFEGDAGEGD